MAGDWLKWCVGVCDKPEILAMSARLMIPPTQTAGTLMLCMEWLDRNVRDLSGDGHATVRVLSMSTNFLDDIVGVSGFTEAMAEVGWITHKDGVLTFINVGRHNGKSAKNRALDAERKRLERLAERPQSVQKNPDIIRTREEKRREDIHTSAPPAAVARQPNPLFDALAEACGSNVAEMTKPAARACGVALADIRRVSVDVTEADIRRRVATYKRLHHDWPCTPNAIAKHWGELGGGPAPHVAEPAKPLPPILEPGGWRDRLPELFALDPIMSNYIAADSPWATMQRSYQRQIAEFMAARKT
jgi:hypothetical protein